MAWSLLLGRSVGRSLGAAGRVPRSGLRRLQTRSARLYRPDATAIAIEDPMLISPAHAQAAAFAAGGGDLFMSLCRSS